MRIHGWDINAGGGPKGGFGIGATKATIHASGAHHVNVKSLDFGARRRGPLVNHIGRRATKQVNIGNISIGQKWRGHSFHVNTVKAKKVAVIGGGALAVGGAAYGAHKVWQRHQAKKNFNASASYHGRGIR